MRKFWSRYRCAQRFEGVSSIGGVSGEPIYITEDRSRILRTIVAYVCKWVGCRMNGRKCQLHSTQQVLEEEGDIKR